MQTAENTKNLGEIYFFIKNSIKNDLEDIANTAVKVVDFGSQELLTKCVLAVRKNSYYLEKSADAVYFGVKNVFRDENYSSRKEREQKPSGRNYSEEKIKYMLPANNLKEKSKQNYSSLIKGVIESSSSTIKEVAIVMGGQICNVYGIKDRKPKRLWKWEYRINYVRGLLSGENVSEAEKEKLNEIKRALQKNSYLKYKRPEYYNELNNYLGKMCI